MFGSVPEELRVVDLLEREPALLTPEVPNLEVWDLLKRLVTEVYPHMEELEPECPGLQGRAASVGLASQHPSCAAILRHRHYTDCKGEQLVRYFVHDIFNLSCL